MQLTHLKPVDLAIIVIYFVAVLSIGFLLKRQTNTSESFFLADRSITSWVAGLSFVAANMGALELMGWASSTYEYGIMTVHWYWIGSVPAILFLAIVMMPFYYRSRATSVPGYLLQRFGEPSRTLSAISFASMTLLMSGINMFAMAKVMEVMLGWNLHFSIWISALTVATYVVLGGLASAILNEVLQFFLIWMGALVIPILGLIECGGWHGLTQRIAANLPNSSQYLHIWSTLGSPQANPMGVDWIGIIFGMALVGGFGYWTTDFLVVQRVMVARDLRTAQMAPVIGAFAKMAIPIIVVLPGLIGLGIFAGHGSAIHLVSENMAHAGDYTYNDVLPLLLIRYAGPGLLGLGVTALIAGFMSGMAGNVSAFATVWTYDIYQPHIARSKTQEHYLQVGRWSSFLGVLLSIGTAYFALHFNSIMDYVQALFSFFVSPLFATVLLGMFWKRATNAGAFWGLLSGMAISISMWIAVRLCPSTLKYVAFSMSARPMAETLYRMLWSWLVCGAVTILVSLVTHPRKEDELVGLVYGCTPKESTACLVWWQNPKFWALIALITVSVLQWIFW
ncbi:MAG TPA: sodium:solute symporter family protein [Acidobacteriaceae bacterium]|jgi:SSS family solute:Na+ symporter|nr:sodium:solute symporter family protein [Acidobacteriaceae bacterium]